MNCVICNKQLRGRQKIACSVICRNKYWSNKLKGKQSFWSGKHHSKEHKKYMKTLVGEKSGGWRGGKMRKNSRYYILNRYGLTNSDYQNILNKQNGVCAICGKPEIVRQNLSIDHDHRCCSGHKSCGKCIRGLLCFRCNQALGLMNDDILILDSAIRYLRKSNV